MNSHKLIGAGLLAGLILMVLASLFPTTGPALAALPTPITMSDRTDRTENVTFWSSTVITSSRGCTAIELPGAEVLDLQWVIDQTDVNTATLKIQFSNDNSHWTDGATFVTNNAADANSMDQFANFGRYTRLYATVTNANPVTVTALAVAK